MMQKKSEKKTNAKTAFVCGFPIAHSRSPLIHRFWLNYYGIKGDYKKIAVSAYQFADFLNAVKNGQSYEGQKYIGGNITLPHKQTAYRSLSHLDEAAKAIKAVNTIWLENGKLFGTNTDWAGFAAGLDQAAPGWDKQKSGKQKSSKQKNAKQKYALMIGAGGAARAVLYALIKRGFDNIIIANRTLSRAQTLADEFGTIAKANCKITVIRLDQINNAIADDKNGQIKLIVNTTSLGLKGSKADENSGLVINFSNVNTDCLVSDIVYDPLVTPFLGAAQKAGLKTVDGLGMLLHQAVPGFEKWFGIRPEVTDDLRQMIVDDLENVHNKDNKDPKKPVIIGLTGSIGMGKSTTAKLFAEFGIAVHDADQIVHDLYSGKAAPLIEAEFPGSVKNGIVDRKALSPQVVGKPEAMKKLEAIIHPLVKQARSEFVESAKQNGALMIVFDIPLLFETGSDKECDFVVVVSTSEKEQRRRVLARADMSVEKFEKILASQLSDAEKRKGADFVVDTSNGVAAAREQVQKIIKQIRTDHGLKG